MQKIIINQMERTIVITKAFYKKACMYGTNEYYDLQKAISENRDYRIVFKTSEKKTYHGLTLERMKEYIKTQPDCEENLKSFEAVKKVAKTKGALYPLTKKWFLERFKDYKLNEITSDEQEKLMESDERQENAGLKIAA